MLMKWLTGIFMIDMATNTTELEIMNKLQLQYRQYHGKYKISPKGYITHTIVQRQADIPTIINNRYQK